MTTYERVHLRLTARETLLRTRARNETEDLLQAIRETIWMTDSRTPRNSRS
jgi:hypothetical protein